MRRATAAVLLLATATAAPRKQRKLSLPRLGSIATKTGAPFLTSQPLLNLLLGIRLRYASWGAPVAHWWPRGGPSSKRERRFGAGSSPPGLSRCAAACDALASMESRAASLPPCVIHAGSVWPRPRPCAIFF